MFPDIQVVDNRGASIFHANRIAFEKKSVPNKRSDYVANHHENQSNLPVHLVPKKRKVSQ